ncbi:helix-turn-helix domain-containing protein [Paenibacillus piscarius]|uniref:helix-turn-helix domain-containing protein n=1 Tax=Paenibacillus piscarius TaxID=1089681 RepID=UPI001EE847F2|nr:helix-turn-helix transcriptional regulator [Paenibacillus piscarius]
MYGFNITPPSIRFEVWITLILKAQEIFGKEVIQVQDESLSDRLNKILKQKGWTRYRLSKESGVPASTIYGIFNRDIGLSFRNIQKIANALGTSEFI